jgi:hypothetical protein
VNEIRCFKQRIIGYRARIAPAELDDVEPHSELTIDSTPSVAHKLARAAQKTDAVAFMRINDAFR